MISKITVLSFNKPAPRWQVLLDTYQKRFDRHRFEHIVIKEKGDSREATRKNASAEVAKKVPSAAKLIILDEKGQGYSSQQFATLLSAEQNQHVCLVIGSSYGLELDTLPPHTLLKMSDFVLAHDVARLLLFEQLYRAKTILDGHPYHK